MKWKRVHAVTGGDEGLNIRTAYVKSKTVSR